MELPAQMGTVALVSADRGESIARFVGAAARYVQATLRAAWLPFGQRGYPSGSCYPSGSGMNSASPLTMVNRPAFQSALACSMRSLREDTKFHQM
jgi:hypothetical protein